MAFCRQTTAEVRQRSDPVYLCYFQRNQLRAQARKTAWVLVRVLKPTTDNGIGSSCPFGSNRS
jgi:hypothetical protein